MKRGNLNKEWFALQCSIDHGWNYKCIF